MAGEYATATATTFVNTSPPQPKCKYKKGDYLRITGRSDDWQHAICLVTSISSYGNSQGYSLSGLFILEKNLKENNPVISTGSYYDSRMEKIRATSKIRAVFREHRLEAARKERLKRQNTFKQSKDPDILKGVKRDVVALLKEDIVKYTPPANYYPMQANENHPIWESKYKCTGMITLNDGRSSYVEWENGKANWYSNVSLTRIKQGFYSKMERSLQPRTLKVGANVHDTLMNTLVALVPGRTFPPCFLLGSHPKNRDYIIDIEPIEVNEGLGGCWGMPTLRPEQISRAQVALAKRGAATSGLAKIGTTTELEGAFTNVGRQGLFMLQLWKQSDGLGLWVKEYIPEHQKEIIHKYSITKACERR